MAVLKRFRNKGFPKAVAPREDEAKKGKRQFVGGSIYVPAPYDNSPAKALESGTGTVSTSLSSYTITSPSSGTATISSAVSAWKSSADQKQSQNIPPIVSNLENQKDVKDDAKATSPLAMTRSRQLPSTWCFSSNHIIVNEDRTQRGITPLVRSCELDTIAREHVERMASSRALFHFSSPKEVQSKFQQPCLGLGVNVARGENIRVIHKAQMEKRADRSNILEARYTHMGMATAQGSDGQMYLCQIFRG